MGPVSPKGCGEKQRKRPAPNTYNSMPFTRQGSNPPALAEGLLASPPNRTRGSGGGLQQADPPPALLAAAAPRRLTSPPRPRPGSGSTPRRWRSGWRSASPCPPAVPKPCVCPGRWTATAWMDASCGRCWERPGCGDPCCAGGSTAVAEPATNQTRRCYTSGASCWRRRMPTQEPPTRQRTPAVPPRRSRLQPLCRRPMECSRRFHAHRAV